MTVTQQLSPEELFEEHMHIASATVHKMFPYVKGIEKKNNLEREDLDAYALEALWQSCLKFDNTKGHRTFRNFAICNIRWQVLARLNKDCKVMSFAHTGINPKDVRYVSLENKTCSDKEDSRVYHDIIGKEYNLEGEVVGKILFKLVENRYPERTIHIIKGRMEGKNNEQIGNELGLSRERVRQILNKVKCELKGVI